MQSYFSKSIGCIFVLATLSYVMSIYLDRQIEVPKPIQQPNWVENISLDYSNAHQALMKKPDEAVVNAF